MISWVAFSCFVTGCHKVLTKRGYGHPTKPALTAPRLIPTTARLGGLSSFTSSTKTTYGTSRLDATARLACLSEHSMSWLNACPTVALRLRLQASEYTVLHKFYLGEPLLPLNQTLTCEACADSMDAYGDHLLCCRKSGFIQRHQALAKQLWHMCNPAGFNATCEVSVSGRSRPEDILLPHWHGGGPCAIDVSVVHPLAPSVACHTVKIGQEAVEAMERVKHSKYDQCCNESNVTLVPFVLSTFGLFGAEAERLFHGITAAARRRAVVDDSCIDRVQYLQQLLISLNREIARQLLQGPLDTAASADAPAPAADDTEQAEAQDDIDRLAATLSPDTENAALSALSPQPASDVCRRNDETAATVHNAATAASVTDPIGDVVMCAPSEPPPLNDVAPSVDNAPADVSMQYEEPHATTNDAQNIVLFLRLARSTDTFPVYINASASVEELEALLQTYRFHPSKHVLLVMGAPIRRDATLASQGIDDRTMIVYQEKSEQ